MTYRIEVRVDGDHSIDPSYIIHYRVADNAGRPMGDGIVQYHRLAAHNDIPVNDTISPAVRDEIRSRVIGAVTDYINHSMWSLGSTENRDALWH